MSCPWFPYFSSCWPLFGKHPSVLNRVCGKKLFLGAGCGVWGVGFYRFWGSQLPNFQGKSSRIFPPIPAMAGTFWGKKSLKVLSNKVFRFIQQALNKSTLNYQLSVSSYQWADLSFKWNDIFSLFTVYWSRQKAYQIKTKSQLNQHQSSPHLLKLPRANRHNWDPHPGNWPRWDR